MRNLIGSRSRVFGLSLCLMSSSSLCCHTLWAQTDLALGQWRTHYTYTKAYGVALYQNHIYANAGHSLLIYDAAHEHLRLHTPADGLSASPITALSAGREWLAVGHQNGHISVLREGEWQDVGALRHDPMQVERQVNTFFDTHEHLYVGGEFGLLVFHASNLAIKDSYLELGPQGTALSVLKGTVLADSLYLATPMGLIAGHQKDNLLDYRQWRRSARFARVRDLLLAPDRQSLYALAPRNQATDLFYYAKGAWVNSATFADKAYESMVWHPDGLLLGHTTGADLWRTGASAAVSFLTLEKEQQWKGGVMHKDGTLWFADAGVSGLGSYKDDKIRYHHPPSPLEMAHPILRKSANGVYAIPSTEALPYRANASSTPMFSYFDGRAWHNVRHHAMGALLDVAEGENGQVYLCGHGTGVWRKIANEYRPLATPSGALKTAFDAASALTTQANGQVIAATEIAKNPFLRYTPPSDRWEALMTQIQPTGRPVRLLAVPDAPLIVSVWEGESVDDLWLIHTETGAGLRMAQGAGLPTIRRIYDVAAQREQLWLATNNGLFRISLSSLTALQPQRFYIDGQPILTDEVVYSLAVDGARALWVGLEGALWRIDAEVARVLIRYDDANSPLPEGAFHALSYADNGSLYIGTKVGMVSYRSPSSIPAKQYNQVRIYPNPVANHYQGQVAITGLVYASVVHVTTLTGQIVRVLQSQGGTAAWDVLDAYGRRPPSGIYILYAVQPDGKTAFAGKIALLK